MSRGVADASLVAGTRARGGGARRAALRPDTLLAAVTVGFFALSLVTIATEVPRFLAAPATDFTLYVERTREWLAGGDFYRDRQLAGPYLLEHGDALYPPSTLLLLIPFTVLPAILWWTPLALVAYAWWRHRPGIAAWNYLALCLCWPKTWEVVIFGNPAMWAVGFIAAGTLWGWPFIGAAVKPILAPFALLGARRRSWWLAAAVGAVAAAAFGPLWLDWLTAMRNAVNPFGLVYLIGDIIPAFLPVVVWTSRARGLAARR